MSQVTQEFWRAPSGRIHSLQRCSGGAPANRMRRVRFTRAEFDRTVVGVAPLDVEGDVVTRCRCAKWRESS